MYNDTVRMRNLNSYLGPPLRLARALGVTFGVILLVGCSSVGQISGQGGLLAQFSSSGSSSFRTTVRTDGPYTINPFDPFGLNGTAASRVSDPNERPRTTTAVGAPGYSRHSEEGSFRSAIGWTGTNGQYVTKSQTIYAADQTNVWTQSAVWPGSRLAPNQSQSSFVTGPKLGK